MSVSWMKGDFIPPLQTQCSGLGESLTSMLGDSRLLRTDYIVFLGLHLNQEYDLQDWHGRTPTASRITEFN